MSDLVNIPVEKCCHTFSIRKKEKNRKEEI